MSNRHGRLVVLSGPTASGKSTLWRRLVQHPGVGFSVSATTRPPRPGERDGRDYWFLDEASFDRHLAAGDFLEWAEVHGRRYGTLRSQIEAALERGEDIVLEIDVEGAARVRRSGLPVVSIFVMPPSMEALEERLRRRGTEGEAEMEKRLSRAAAEIERASEYDHVVVNDDLEDLVAEVEGILGLEGGS